MKNICNNTHGGNTKQFLSQYGYTGDRIFDFSVNTFPYSFPNELLHLLSDCIPKMTQYPDIDNTEFVHTVSKVENIPPECIVPLNGSAQGMYAICSMPEVQSVITFEPTFIEYKIAAQTYQKQWRWIHREELNQSYESLEQIEPFSLVFLCNPNNPDGNVISESIILEILDIVSRKNSWLIVDEAFIEFVPNHSVIRVVSQSKNIIVFRSLTKFFGLAGLRCGYLAAHAETAERIQCFIPPWSLNMLSQKAGAWVLDHTSYFYDAGKTWKQEADRLIHAFGEATQLKIVPSDTSYFQIQFGNEKKAQRFQQQLAQKGIMVRNCGNYEGLDGSYIRIGARDHESNAYLLDTLQSTEMKWIYE